MPAADDAPDGFVYYAADQVGHDLLTPVTNASARAQLLTRDIQRSSFLPEEERTRLLEGLAAIQTAVQTLCAVTDTIGRSSADGTAAPPAGERQGEQVEVPATYAVTVSGSAAESGAPRR
jgi:hypothetical protein